MQDGCPVVLSYKHMIICSTSTFGAFHVNKVALLTGAVHLSHFEDETFKVLRCSKYSHLTSLAPRTASKSGSPKIKWEIFSKKFNSWGRE